ncbi:MAG: phosphatidylglycerophosphatase A [Proteobacteria bacterium]|nr:phosphatidylglycerophosphatase A [Pseudomonadota bacterium]
MQKFCQFFATGFYSGYLPLMPGTWGSLVGLALTGMILSYSSISMLLVLTILFFFLGLYTTHYMILVCQHLDPKEVVVDEIVAIMGIILFLKWQNISLNFWSLIIVFILFRLFDMFKPWPINQIEEFFYKKPSLSALGVMIDDIVAGVLTFVVFFILNS